MLLTAKPAGGVAKGDPGCQGNPMDQRIESFLTDVLALAEEPDAVREGVRVALAKCEAIFRLQEPKMRMRDQATRLPRALPRSRSRGIAAQGNTHRRPLEAGAQHA
jgi:hypothetical protein